MIWDFYGRPEGAFFMYGKEIYAKYANRQKTKYDAAI